MIRVQSVLATSVFASSMISLGVVTISACGTDEQFGGEGFETVSSDSERTKPSSTKTAGPDANEDDAADPETPSPSKPSKSMSIPESYPATCSGLTQRLDDCELLKPAPFPCTEPESETEECIFQCNLLASCSILRNAVCGGITADPLARCYAACELVECDDGTLISKDSLCDNEADCREGEDEFGCDWFRCGGLGEDIPLRFECDAVEDCQDGSDEHDGCLDEYFVCETTNEVLPWEYECDGEDDCADGSDEHLSCKVQVFTCVASGEELPARYECDGEEDCLDGSDEHDACGGFLCE